MSGLSPASTVSPSSEEALAAPSAPRVPHSRRRDKPQLSCNLCRRRKLKCDRAQPCSTCAHRGLSLSCTYSDNSHISQPAQRAQRPQQSALQQTPHAATMQNRIGQLEKLVVELMGNMKESTASSSNSMASVDTTSPPADFTHVDYTEDATQLDDRFGRISLGNSGTKYVENDHWSAILDGIAELKEYFEGTEDPEPPRWGDPGDVGGPAVIFGRYKHTTKQELLATLPPKIVADRVIANFFATVEYGPVIIHGPTFLKEYERFWSKPADVSLMWLSILFSMMCISYQLQILITAANGQPPNEKVNQDLERQVQLCKESSTQALVLGHFTDCAPYTVEALLLHCYIEYFAAVDTAIGPWAFLATVIRIALRMGYHRDGSHSDQITVYQAEMRRRVWTILTQMDTMTSSQIGLPRMIKETMSDTKEPSNLLDEDLYEEMTVLPPPRPAPIVARIYGAVAKNRLLTVQCMISETTSSPWPSSYGEVMKLDRLLRDTYANFPPSLHVKPMDQCMFDDPGDIIRRGLLKLVYWKLTVLLHRRYLLQARTDNRFAYSRKMCLDAAVETLLMQQMLDQETHPGGRMYQDRWKLSSPLIKQEFLLATTILCLDVDQDLKLEVTSGKHHLVDLDARNRALAVLEVSLGIWSDRFYRATSEEARKAIAAITLVLIKAGKIPSTSDSGVLIPAVSSSAIQADQAPAASQSMPAAFVNNISTSNPMQTVDVNVFDDLNMDFNMDEWYLPYQGQHLDDILGTDIDLFTDVQMTSNRAKNSESSDYVNSSFGIR